MYFWYSGHDTTMSKKNADFIMKKQFKKHNWLYVFKSILRSTKWSKLWITLQVHFSSSLPGKNRYYSFVIILYLHIEGDQTYNWSLVCKMVKWMWILGEIMTVYIYDLWVNSIQYAK